MVRIVGVQSSPRKSRNTETLLTSALAAWRRRVAEVAAALKR